MSAVNRVVAGQDLELVHCSRQHTACQSASASVSVGQISLLEYLMESASRVSRAWDSNRELGCWWVQGVWGWCPRTSRPLNLVSSALQHLGSAGQAPRLGGAGLIPSWGKKDLLGTVGSEERRRAQPGLSSPVRRLEVWAGCRCCFIELSEKAELGAHPSWRTLEVSASGVPWERGAPGVVTSSCCWLCWSQVSPPHLTHPLCPCLFTAPAIWFASSGSEKPMLSCGAGGLVLCFCS